MSRRAIRFLNQKGIHFKLVEYIHDVKGASFAAKSTGFPMERAIKTLVVDLGRKGNVIVLMPGDKSINLKRLAEALSVKRSAIVALFRERRTNKND
ncbi:MAG: hypothetical protein B6I32_02645 [Desulfobacterium sp. 4572_20]|nr:MAG: hypothetical protein B6I32_02645 [Desulfobacterium sp. 4572_20]RLB22851.1 MAG: hypothetical protein DRG73_06270 [Deltaproteobacteria bacterium]HDH87397.1 hypothetical protein [Desulfobacteraceae bacterium]